MDQKGNVETLTDFLQPVINGVEFPSPIEPFELTLETTQIVSDISARNQKRPDKHSNDQLGLFDNDDDLNEFIVDDDGAGYIAPVQDTERFHHYEQQKLTKIQQNL